MDKKFILEPVYVQISEDIKEKINTKKINFGDKLPTENELTDYYKTSRGTIRKALDILTEQDYIEKIHGKGSFVKGSKISSPIAQKLVSISESLEEQNLTFSTRVLKSEIIRPNSHIMSKLNVSEDAEILYLERTRSIDNEVVIYLENWINISKVTGIEQYNFNKVSLFSAIEECLGEKISYGVRTISAKEITKKIQRILKIGQNILLNINQTTYDMKNIPIETSEIYIKDSRYQITSTLER